MLRHWIANPVFLSSNLRSRSISLYDLRLAQPGRALALGARGRTFDPCNGDQLFKEPL